MIAYVWAQDQNGLIGRDGDLPWHLPDDLKFFKERTINQIIVMGRKTFTGMGSRPLPKRTNIVLTRQATVAADSSVLVMHDKEAVLKYAQMHADQDLMIIGGAEIFRLFADVVETLYVTRIAGSFEGDTYMTDLPWATFEQTAARTVINDQPELTHTFETWVRRSAAREIASEDGLF